MSLLGLPLLFAFCWCFVSPCLLRPTQSIVLLSHCLPFCVCLCWVFIVLYNDAFLGLCVFFYAFSVLSFSNKYLVCFILCLCLELGSVILKPSCWRLAYDPVGGAIVNLIGMFPTAFVIHEALRLFWLKREALPSIVYYTFHATYSISMLQIQNIKSKNIQHGAFKHETPCQSELNMLVKIVAIWSVHSVHLQPETLSGPAALVMSVFMQDGPSSTWCQCKACGCLFSGWTSWVKGEDFVSAHWLVEHNCLNSSPRSLVIVLKK